MSRREEGFTIIELMIATVVFSVVLLTISAAIIQIGRVYSKGVTEAQVQSTARGIMDDLTQAIELAPGGIMGTDSHLLDNGSSSRAVCIGSRRYSFTLGPQLSDSQHVLVVDDTSGPCNNMIAQPLTGSISGNELVGQRMRLSNLVVQERPESPDLYEVSVRLVYGDDDLLCSPSQNPAKCTSNTPMTHNELMSARDLKCKDIRSGSQFCSVSELETVVERRMK